jgi:hypothetical protein
MSEKEYTWSEYRERMEALADETGLIKPPRVIYDKPDAKLKMYNPRVTTLRLTSRRSS